MIGYKIKHYTKLRFLSCGEYPMVYIDDDVMYIYIYIYTILMIVNILRHLENIIDIKIL